MLNLLRRIKRKLGRLAGWNSDSSSTTKATIYIRLGISSGDMLRFNQFSQQHKELPCFETSLLGKPLTTFNNSYWYYHSIDELFVDEVYKSVLNTEQPYILDCGANIGLSVIYFKKQWPNATVIAFEPDEKNFEYLNKNTEDNREI